MNREEFLRQFTGLIRVAFEQEGQDFGELLLSVYMTMVTAESVRPAKYQELNQVFSNYGAKSRFAYDDGESCSAKIVRTLMHLEQSEVWKLVRRRPNDDWPDEL